MSVLVTGGAGYVGSHTVVTMLDQGADVVVLDDLSTGLQSLVPEAARFYRAHAGSGALLRDLFNQHNVTAVIHFAGSIVVPDSVLDPMAYYRNNTVTSHHLIEACVNAGVKNFVFSSSAAVYGIPEINPVTEEAVPRPINPYGRSKLMTEWMLEDAARAWGLNYVALRYFNVAGADPQGRTGQSGLNATHLIKRACQAALGRIPTLDIFGTDYPTPDGTCIRDYIHVTDLVAAHLEALAYLENGGRSTVLNCGYGHGFSVREVIDAVSQVSGKRVPTVHRARRPGDPPVLIADSTRLRAQLHWQPKFDELQKIVSTAFMWERGLHAPE